MEEKNNIISDSKLKIIFVVIGLLLGLVNLSNAALYYGGFVFLCAGLLLSLSERETPSLLFLFTHGLTGITLLIVSTLDSYFGDGEAFSFLRSPVLSDTHGYITYYYYFLIALIIYSFYKACKYNLNDEYKNKNYSLVSILVLFLIIIMLVLFLPKFYIYL